MSLLLLSFVPALAASACDRRMTTSGDVSPIARVHLAKCGACHMRVEPGSHPRRDLQEALSRHKTRVPLRDAEWADLLDYLTGANAKAETQGH